MGRTESHPQRLANFGDVVRAEMAAGIRACVAEICERFNLPADRRAPAVAALLGEPVAPASGELLSLPFAAPELYVHRRVMKHLGRRETIVEFLQRVWGLYLDGKLLTRASLRKLDASADKAVENWLRQHELPPEIDLPSYPRRPRKKSAKLNTVA